MKINQTQREEREVAVSTANQAEAPCVGELAALKTSLGRSGVNKGHLQRFRALWSAVLMGLHCLC